MPLALVTGIAGQTGGYLAEQLAERGWTVHGVARSADRGGPDAADLSAAQLHNVDLVDHPVATALVDELEPDAVFNLAGISSVAASWADPMKTAEVNGAAVANLLLATAALADRTGKAPAFVQASSAEMFGLARTAPQNESTPIDPANPYGAAKAFAHHLVHVYRTTGLRASSCILYNHESPRRPVTFVTRKITVGVARVALGLDDSLTLGNLEARRDWGWAPDYADALLRAAEHPSGGDFVIATGVSHTIREFALAAFEAAGVTGGSERIRVDDALRRPTDAPLLVGDATRAARELGWHPTRGFEEIVSAMVAHDLSTVARDA